MKTIVHAVLLLCICGSAHAEQPTFLFPGVPQASVANDSIMAWSTTGWKVQASQPVGTSATPTWLSVTGNPALGSSVSRFYGNSAGVAVQLRAPTTTNGGGLALTEADGAYRAVVSIAPTTRDLKIETATGAAGSESFVARMTISASSGSVNIPGALVVTGAAVANSWNGNTITAGTGTLTLGAGKTLTASNTITLTATDGSTLAIGTGGTLGTAAYTATTDYATAAQGSAADTAVAVQSTTPLTAYAAGTAYALTDTAAALDFGTTDPTITFATAGTYLISTTFQLRGNGATVASEEVTVKLRRTNNTPADLTGSTSVIAPPATTTTSRTILSAPLPPITYTASAGDVVTIFGNISAALGAGTIDATEASIVAIRLY